MSLKFYFEIIFELWAKIADYHNARYFATERQLIWIPFDLLEGAYYTSFRFSTYARPGFQNVPGS
jgi:hypothetical protein